MIIKHFSLKFSIHLFKAHPAIYAFFFMLILYTAHFARFVFSYIFRNTVFISIWLAVGLSIQRFFALKYPLSNEKHCCLSIYPYLIIMPAFIFLFKLQYFTKVIFAFFVKMLNKKNLFVFLQTLSLMNNIF